MEHTLIVLSALLLNVLLAGPPRLQRALGLAYISHLPAHGVRDIERRLNRDHRTLQERVVRGWVFTLFAAAAALLFGWLFSWICEGNWRFAEVVLVALLLPFRQSWDTAAAIRKGLRNGSINEARRVLAGSIWKHHARLDEHGVARAAIETLAISFAEKTVAPVLFYLLFGLPGLLLSKTIYLLQETLARPTESEQAFAKASRQLHYLLHYIPARVTALIWCVAAIFLPSAHTADALQQVVNGLFGELPQDIALLSAASVLQVSLGGPMSAYVHEGWIGGGTAKARASDIGRAQRAYVLVHVLLFCLIGLFI